MAHRLIQKPHRVCVDGHNPGFSYQAPIRIEKKTMLGTQPRCTPVNGLTVFPLVIEIYDPDHFIPLDTLTLHQSIRIVKTDNTVLPEGHEKVAPVNNIAISMHGCIKTRINDQEINQESAHHMPYKSILGIPLSYNEDPAEQFCAGGYYNVKDASKMDLYTAENVEWTKMCEKYKKSKVVSTSSTLPIDIISADCYLAPDTKLTLEFYPTEPSFHLMQQVKQNATSVKTEFTEFYMEYRKMKVSPTDAKLILGGNNPSSYKLPYTEVRAYQIPSGVSRWNVPVFPNDSPLPKQIVVAQVKTSDMNSINKNPFKFHHNNINYIAPRIDGIVPINTALEPNFDKGYIAEAYYQITRATGKEGSPTEGTLITMKNFKENQTLFPFDLSPDNSNGRTLQKSKYGKLDIAMGWSTQLNDSVTVLVYCVMDQSVNVDKSTKKISSVII